MEPRLVIFDVDGTLVDSQHVIVAAMDLAFAAHGRPAPARAATLSVVGLSLVEAMRRLAGPDAPAEALAASYKDAFHTIRADPAHHEPFYPGALDALDALAALDDVVLGIATGKSRRGVGALIERHGLGGRFHTIQTADDHPSKPHPSMVVTAIAEAGAAASATIMVGDTTFDMEMARGAGAGAIGVAWGYHPAEHLVPAGAHALVERYGDLLPALAALFAERAGVAA